MVDVNKGDEENPEYRSRLVATQIKNKDRSQDLFAATPPLAANKMLMSMAMAEGIGFKVGQEHQGLMLDFSIYVRRACVFADIKRTVDVDLPGRP